MIDNELTLNDLYLRGRKTWLLLSLPRLYYSPYLSSDISLIYTFLRNHTSKNPIPIKIYHYTTSSSNSTTLCSSFNSPTQSTSSSIFSSLICQDNSSSCQQYRYLSFTFPIEITTSSTIPSIKEIPLILYESFPSLFITSTLHHSSTIFSLTLLSEIRIESFQSKKSNLFRNFLSLFQISTATTTSSISSLSLSSSLSSSYLSNQSNELIQLEDEDTVVGIYSLNYSLKIQFQDPNVCYLFIKSLRYLQYLQRYYYPHKFKNYFNNICVQDQFEDQNII